MTRQMRAVSSGRRGSALIEFALVALQLCLVIFAAFEFCRMALVYTNVSNAARVGARYAITHGSRRSTGLGFDSPSGPGNVTNICQVVREFAQSGLINASTGYLPCLEGTGTAAGIHVTYPNGINTPGNPVTVTFVYPYDPFTLRPLGVKLSSTSQGIITF